MKEKETTYESHKETCPFEFAGKCTLHFGSSADKLCIGVEFCNNNSVLKR